MKPALVLCLVLLTAACHHGAPVVPSPRPDRYALPSEARPADLFCVQPSPFDVTTSDEAHGLVCVSVEELRLWLRGRRFANP